MDITDVASSGLASAPSTQPMRSRKSKTKVTVKKIYSGDSRTLDAANLDLMSIFIIHAVVVTVPSVIAFPEWSHCHLSTVF